MLPWELYVKSLARIDAKAREESTARLIEWYLDGCPLGELPPEGKKAKSLPVGSTLCI